MINTFRLTFLGAAAVAAVLACPTGATAEEAPLNTDNELLRQGMEHFENLEYERSVETLSAALLEPGNDVSERTVIYRTLGTLYVYLNRPQEADLALTRLLCADPAFDFGEYASPRIREVFERVRQQWQSEGRPCAAEPGQATAAPVNMDHDSPTSADRGDEVELNVTIQDPELRVNSVILHYRASGEAGFNTAPASMVSPGTFTATIPGDAVQPPATEYFIRAVSDSDEALAAIGTERAPLRVPVDSGGGGGGVNVARTWWFWTIIGAVVVGTGLGLGLGLGLDSGSDDNGRLSIIVCDGESENCFN